MPEPAIQNQTHPAPKELAVEMRRLIGVLRQGWRLIAISAVVCLTIAGLYVAAAKRVLPGDDPAARPPAGRPAPEYGQ